MMDDLSSETGARLWNCLQRASGLHSPPPAFWGPLSTGKMEQS